MADNKRRLVDESDRLMAALDEIRAMEAEKRQMDISGDEFDALAERIHEKSREIFQMTGVQEETAHDIAPTSESIDDVADQT